jgi:hypothetical protein
MGAESILPTVGNQHCERAPFTDMLTTLRRVSYEEKTEQLLLGQCPLKTWIAQLTELLSRTG